jgi:hypothetical protein
MPERLVITSEDEAWEILDAIAHDRIDPESFTSIEFIGWAPEILYFPSEPVPHSVSQTSVRSVDEFYDHLSRIYALVLYGRASIKILKYEDRRALDIKLIVIGESSGYRLPDKELTALFRRMISKMTGRQIVATLVFVAVLYVGYTGYKLWVQEQAAVKKLQFENETERFRSEEETRRLEIVSKIVARIPNGDDIRDESDKAKQALTRAGASQPKSRVLGVDLTGEEAQQLVGQERRQGEGRRVDGRFKVVEIDSDTEEGWIVRLESAETAFDAEVSKQELTEDDIDAIFFSIREKAEIDMLVNAWFVGERVKRAVVVRAQRPEPREVLLVPSQ